jgi:prepilin-type N-terminal cleavage/methylation domain-containing protein
MKINQFQRLAAISLCVCALRRRRRAFTLVELLAVIVIIGVVLALIFPAIMSARESSRRSACANNLRQCSTAVLIHLETFRHFPTGGWGKYWVGMPSGGVAEKQPGGWIYNTLPFLEQAAVHDAGKQWPPDDPNQRQANAERLMTPLEVMNCPSRRRPGLFRDDVQTPFYCDDVSQVARGDYAMNGGHKFIRIGDRAPTALPVPKNFPWPDMSAATGLSYMRSRVTAAEVIDGFGYTYLVGEKHVYHGDYNSGEDWGDNESLYTGDDRDVLRYTGDEDDPAYRPRPDSYELTKTNVARGLVFGSAHPHGFNMALCDGSIHHVRFDVDPIVHSRLGRRNDRKAVELPK